MKREACPVARGDEVTYVLGRGRARREYRAFVERVNGSELVLRRVIYRRPGVKRWTMSPYTARLAWQGAEIQAVPRRPAS